MRINAKLRTHYRAIHSYSGLIAACVGVVLLTPLLMLLRWPEEWRHAPAFVVPGGLLLAAGLFVYRRFHVKDAVLSMQEGGVIVLLSWLTACIAGTIPIMYTADLNLTQAVFESVSGWTTTGLSVVDVTTAPKMLLFFRSTMQLVGGAGLAIVTLAALTGPVGPGLSSAEGRDQQLLPNVKQSTRLVVTMYAGYVLFGILAYQFAGMNFFDAINHAFCAVSTGGFSTKPDSIGHWDSAAVEFVSLPLMLCGTVNFMTAYLILQRRFKPALRSGELRLMGVTFLICAPLILFIVAWPLYETSEKAVRVAVFETFSALSTTGYSTVGYTDWNGFGIVVLILLMIMGGGTGSTAGAMKQYRVYIMFKALCWEFKLALLPSSAVHEGYVWRGLEKDYISDARLRRIAVFVFMYLATLFIGSAILAAHGNSLRDSMFEFASTLGTVGLSIGVTQPDAPALVLWTQIAGMILGRLEFFVVIVSALKLVRDLPALTYSPPAGGTG